MTPTPTGGDYSTNVLGVLRLSLSLTSTSSLRYTVIPTINIIGVFGRIAIDLLKFKYYIANKFDVVNNHERCR